MHYVEYPSCWRRGSSMRRAATRPSGGCTVGCAATSKSEFYPMLQTHAHDAGSTLVRPAHRAVKNRGKLAARLDERARAALPSVDRPLLEALPLRSVPQEPEVQAAALPRRRSGVAWSGGGFMGRGPGLALDRPGVAGVEQRLRSSRRPRSGRSRRRPGPGASSRRSGPSRLARKTPTGSGNSGRCQAREATRVRGGLFDRFVVDDDALLDRIFDLRRAR